MRDSLRRLTVYHSGKDGPQVVDFVLPSTVSVAELLPSVVDLVDPDGHRDGVERQWRLSPVGCAPLEPSMTLEDNDVDDGAVLVLSTAEIPPPRWAPGDPIQMLAHADNVRDTSMPHTVAVFCALLMGAAGAVALAWSATRASAPGHFLIAFGVAVAAATAAVAARRARVDRLPTAFAVLAVMYTGTAGYCAVPATPSARVLLASSAAFSAALLLLRLRTGGTAGLTAIATVTGLCAAVSATAVAWRLDAVVFGAVLATLGLATLAVAPRLAIAAAGVGPPAPSLDDAPAADLGMDRVVHAHALLTGVVVGSSASAALGATTTMLAEQGLPIDAVLFGGVVGLALLLRTRTHADPTRRGALAVCGVLSAIAVFVSCVVELPGYAYWLSLLTAAAGMAALCRLVAAADSPIALRICEAIEYVALAAVVPLACWVAGGYGLIRDASLL